MKIKIKRFCNDTDFVSLFHCRYESNVKNGARVVTMCNAMRRNENHFGRVTFLLCVRALPPPPAASDPRPRHRRRRVRTAVAPTGGGRGSALAHTARRYETRTAPRRTAPPARGLGDATVTPVGRRPKTRRSEGGPLGIRRLDVIDPNRIVPRVPLPRRPFASDGRTCARARV